MRVRGTLSCVAAVGVVLTAAGCGGDDGGENGPVAAPVPTVPVPGSTVTTTATVTVPTTTTTPVTVTRRAPSPTTTRGATPSPPRPSTSDPSPATTTATPGKPDDSDPVGGTTFSLGPGRGTGYTVRVPDGWFDGSRRLEGSGVPFDLSYVRGRGDDVTSNILIVRDGSGAQPGQDIDDVARRVRREIDENAAGGDVSRGPGLQVDGDRAISFVVRRSVGGRAFVQRKVAVLHRGALFTAGLTSLRADAQGDATVFRAFLRSWRWE